MDPFYSYASRFVTWDDEDDDNNRKLPEDSRLRSIVVPERPGSEKHIEFNVQINAICAVLPYIKTMFDIYPTKRRLGIESATADHMQILLKYMNTNVYDPTDISHRHRNKHDIVFRYIDFYLFCQKLGYKSLSDVVRSGIQATLDFMTWSPAPAGGDTVLLYPGVGSNLKESNEKSSTRSAPLLASLLSACELYYPKIKPDDPIGKSLLVYGHHLWTEQDPIWRTLSPENIHDAKQWPDTQTSKRSSEFRSAMEEYDSTTLVHIYRSEAPKYHNQLDFVLWTVGFGVISVVLSIICLLALMMLFIAYTSYKK